jgi:peptidyl-prolyl cis-trans isomerase D
MFEFLRRLIVPIIIVVLFFFVAMIILQWGADITSSRRVDDTAGVIDGEEISIQEYDRFYSRLLRQEQDKVQTDLSSEKVEEIRQQAWMELVSGRILNREIERRGIHVTNEEIYGFLRMYPPPELQSAPQFMTDGQFDYQKYVNAMVSPENALFWAQVEAFILPDLKKLKLQEEILNTVRVTPAEVLEEYLRENEKVQIGYIHISNPRLRSVISEPTEEELKEYYETHKEDYKLERRAVIQAVTFDRNPSENDWDYVYYMIKDIYDSAVAGADFAELALTYSEDESAAKGGDLGWFARGRMPAIDSVAWSLEIGEISKPFKSEFGWHILKLIDKKKEKETPEGSSETQMVEKCNAAHILLNVKPSQETLDQLFMNAKDFAEAAKEKGFEETAEEFNYQLKTSKPFMEGGFVPFIGMAPAASETIFKSKPGTVLDVGGSEQAYYVINVMSQVPEGYTPYEEIENAIAGTLIRKKMEQAAMDTAQVIYDAIAEGMSFNKSADKFGFSYERSSMITRKSFLPNIGMSPEVTGAAFALQNINEVSRPIQYDRGAAILTLLDRESPNLEEFNKIQDSLYVTVLQKKHQDIYNRWFDHILNNTDVENYLDRFYKQY